MQGGGLLFLNTGFTSARLLAVRPGGRGHVTEQDAIAWTSRRSVPTMSSALFVDGRIYMVSDGGVVSCLDAETGESLWAERIGGEFSASPVLVSGRIYFFDREGRTTVIAAEPEYRELAVNELEEGFMASPAIIGDALILRSKTHLYRIEAPAER